MARVTGIGGVFLRSADPKRLAAWYSDHLGIALTPWGGAKFEGSGVTAWSVFKVDPAPFGDAAQQVMVNYRVDDLDDLLSKLQTLGSIWIDPKREDGEFGKFAWIRDCDGNRVELWQPPAAGTAK